MIVAQLKQNLLDWATQQWVIWSGKKIHSERDKWLLGPLGSLDGIGSKYIEELAEKEQLIVDKSGLNKGLIQSINQLNLTVEDLNRLSPRVIDFYENTGNYSLDLCVKWNPFFKSFGFLLRVLFSQRIEQLNVPLTNTNDANVLQSQIINLLDSETKDIKRTIWLRRFKSTREVVYSGVYETCVIPSGRTCIKAIFPLPNGNATVILNPSVGKNGSLKLLSSGKKFGDSGFYFLLKDSQENLWSRYIPSFQDELVVNENGEGLMAVQTLTLWGFRVLIFTYLIKKLI